MADLQPIRCPKCGGYKVQDDTNFGCLDIALIICTAGLWIMVIVFKPLMNRNKPVKTGDKLYCSICGYRWAYCE